MVTILSWDGPTSPRLERLVDQSVEQLTAECGRPSRFRVWLERRPGSGRRIVHHVRLDVELSGPGALAGWQMRAESSGPSVERSLRSALRAVSTFARSSRGGSLAYD